MEKDENIENNIEKNIMWSIEILPQNIDDISFIPNFINEIYITMIPGGESRDTIAAAKHVQSVGKHAIPHLAARSFRGKEDLEESLCGINEAGIERCLLIGGGYSKPAGDMSCVMDLLTTNLFEKYGIKCLDFAGHPEGNPDDPNSEIHLLEKLIWAEENKISARIVTQWGFDTEGSNNWITRLREKGVGNPIHLGIPGPSTIKTLMRFAKVCGVSASATVLRKYGLNISKLMFVNKPDKIISDLQGYDQLHLYPFGGIEKSSEWLNEWMKKE